MAGAARARSVPDREVEKALIASYGTVAGMDEVGRGALAGPVSVGVAVVDPMTTDDVPAGLRDSKLLSPARREALVVPVRDWVVDAAVAHASAEEIDRLGIVAALRLAGRRALAELAGRGCAPGVVLLDGSHDWLSAPQDLLGSWEASCLSPGSRGEGGDPEGTTSSLALAPAVQVPAVVTRVRADAGCAVVAAASVLAKVERDALMEGLEDPGYDWASNKGYASARHVEGLRLLGASALHRRSWRLPGVHGAGFAQR